MSEVNEASPANKVSDVERLVRSSDYKQALGDVFHRVKSMKRFDLEWEWMAETDNGQYIERDDLINWLLGELKT